MRVWGIYDWTNRANVHYIWMDGKIRWWFGWSDYQKASYSANTLYEINMTADSWNYDININWTSYTWTYSWTVQVSTSRPYYLFCNQENWTPKEYFSWRIYYFKVTTSEWLIRDLVPCYRVADWAGWLYDLVEGKFYGNSWTWTFIKWAPVNVWQMPSWYTELAYIQNNSTSIIDTWLKTWIWYKVRLGLYTAASTTADQTVIWWSTNTSAEAIYFWLNYAGNHLSIYRWYNGSWFDADNSISVWNYYEAESLIRNWEQKLTLNWTVLYTGSAALSWTGSENMIIFNRRSSTTYPALIKLYYTKIYDVNDVLVRDFVPCVRDSDEVIWLYDLVTKQFFTNSWSGSFVAGPVVMRGWYKMSTNTITYCKLAADSKDEVSGSNYSNVWVTFGTAGWVGGAYFNWWNNQSYLYDDNIASLPQGASVRTIGFWIYDTKGDVSWENIAFWCGNWASNQMVSFGQYNGSVWPRLSQYWQLSTGSWREYNKWLLYIITYDWSKFSIYKNWTLLWEWTYSIATSWTKVRLWWWTTRWNDNYFKWYMREMFIENKLWTAEMAQRFYNEVSWFFN